MTLMTERPEIFMAKRTFGVPAVTGEDVHEFPCASFGGSIDWSHESSRVFRQPPTQV